MSFVILLINFFILIIVLFISASAISYGRHIHNYQEDFLTPGNIPSFANSLKQMRHRPKSLIKAFPRPQRKHRFFCRVLNFGFFAARALTDVFAIVKITPIFIDDIVYFFLKPYKNPQRPKKTSERNTDQSIFRLCNTSKIRENSQIF